jgi:hypothetical protein
MFISACVRKRYFVSYVETNVTHMSITRQRIAKQARNQYATNNRVDSFLGNARNTCTQY